MKHRARGAAALVCLLLASCGGGDGSPVSQPTPAESAAVALGAATATVPTPSTPPGAANRPTPTVAATATTGGEPSAAPTAAVGPGVQEATAVTDATAAPTEAAEAQPTPQAQPSLGLPAGKLRGPDSPLAIPAASLRKLGLEIQEESPLGGEDVRTFRRFRARRLMSNEWVAGSDKGVALVLDERLELPSEEAATRFLEQQDREARRGDPLPFRPLRNGPDLGDESRAYFATSGQGGQVFKGYAFVFRTGRIVGRIAVIGGKGMTQTQAFGLARQGAQRTRQALGR